MRVYVPLTLSGLAAAHRAGELGPGPLAAYAVTPALREWYVSDDIEELEYAALNRAAPASLRLLAGDPGAVRRRVVVAVDVPDGRPSPTRTAAWTPSSLGEVRIAAAVPLAKAAAVHVDADDAEKDVAAAAAALGAADLGRRRRAVHRGRRGGPRAALVRDAGDPQPDRLTVAGAERADPLSCPAGIFIAMGTNGKHRTHLVWDWNGTLFHDNDAVIGATNAAFAEVGLEPITLEQYRELYCVPIPRFYERLMGRLPTDAEWEVMDEIFHRHYWSSGSAAGSPTGAEELLAAVAARPGAASRCSACTSTSSWCRWCGRTASSGTSCGWTAAPGRPAAARPSTWSGISPRWRACARAHGGDR